VNSALPLGGENFFNNNESTGISKGQIVRKKHYLIDGKFEK